MPHIVAVVGVGLVFGLLAWAGITLTREEGRIAIVWLPNAFLIAILLRSTVTNGLTYLPSALAGNIVANLLAGDSFLGGSSLALVNSLEIILVWFGMRLLNKPRPRMEQLPDLLIFCGIGGFLAPSISGLFATSLLADGDWASAAQLWLKWSMSDGLGILLLAPIIMIFHDLWTNWRQAGSRTSNNLKTISALEWSVVLAAGLGVSLIVFGQTQFPLLFMVMPVILLHAFRLGAAGTAICTLQIAVVATILTSLDLGPMHMFDASLSEQLFTLQLFLFCCFCIGLPVSAAMVAKQEIRVALKESISRSKLVAQAAPIGIFQADIHGNLLYANEGVCDMMDMTVEKIIADGSMASLDVPSPWDDHTFIEGQEYSGSPRKLQIPIPQEDGKELWLETLDVPELDRKGNITGYTGVVIDISDGKALEKDLISARRHAEAAADAKTRFLANMSHEIRTPMNGVIGFAQLLLDSEMPDEQRQQTQMIYESGNAMMRLLNDILDISKIEAGRFKSNREPIDIRHVLDSCLKLMAPTADQKGLATSLDVDPSIPEMVIVDSHHLRQVLLNLLGNAVKFTHSGRVKLCVFPELRADGIAMIVIEVQDTGIGIAQDRLNHIFDPFEQAENTTAQEFGGSGLGLTISQQLATVMDGELKVKSSTDQGTVFQLKIPTNITHQLTTKEKEAVEIELLTKPVDPHQPRDSSDQCKGRILLVEDHDVNQMLIRAMTERLGYQTELATDGAEAVRMVDESISTNQPFDMVLMDVQMPVMNGHQATQMIRASGVSAGTLPIVAITANAYSDDIESCLAVGMQAHISKPVMIGKLQSALDQWVKNDTAETATTEKIDVNPGSFLNGELAQRYRQRKEEVVHCLTSIVRSATYSETELREAADHLHKLAGTAALFGEADIGIKAKLIENGLTQWRVDDRPKNIKQAVGEFLKAA